MLLVASGLVSGRTFSGQLAGGVVFCRGSGFDFVFDLMGSVNVDLFFWRAAFGAHSCQLADEGERLGLLNEAEEFRRH